MVVSWVVTSALCSWTSVSGILEVTQWVAPCFPLNGSDDLQCLIIRGTMRSTITSISLSGQLLSTITFIILESLQ